MEESPLGYDKYNWEEHPDHFILGDCQGEVDFGEGMKGIYALEGAQVLVQREKEVQLAVNGYGSGRAVYLSGLPYSFENSRLLHRAVLWSTHSEEELNRVNKFYRKKYKEIINEMIPQNDSRTKKVRLPFRLVSLPFYQISYHRISFASRSSAKLVPSPR